MRRFSRVSSLIISAALMLAFASVSVAADENTSVKDVAEYVTSIAAEK